MYCNEILKKFVSIFEAKQMADEIQDMINDENYLQCIKRGIAILKVTKKITKDNITTIMKELTSEFNNKYNTKFNYNEDYIATIDMMINELEKVMINKLQNKLTEKIGNDFIEEVLNNE